MSATSPVFCAFLVRCRKSTRITLFLSRLLRTAAKYMGLSLSVCSLRFNLYVLHSLQGHTNAIRSLALSRDGQTLYSGSRDNTIRVWRTRDGLQLRVIEGHASYVQACSDGRRGEFPLSSLRAHANDSAPPACSFMRRGFHAPHLHTAHLAGTETVSWQPYLMQLLIYLQRLPLS
jgi:hypothetical protein